MGDSMIKSTRHASLTDSRPLLILGIETSCDETAAAVVSSDKRILSNVVRSQLTEHADFGGVVPEIAARAHIQHIEPVLAAALRNANVTLADIDAIAATTGPGLIGGVIVGTMTGKALALTADKPFIAVNHLEGHALTARLTGEVAFPYLLLLVSGGHCQFLMAHGVGHYDQLGATRDDALGEAFDKTAKMLGLGAPGGPAVEQAALKGNPRAFPFTVPMKGREGCDFSFSGIKTAVRELARAHAPLDVHHIADICASFQYTVGESVADRTRHAITLFKKHCPQGTTLVVAGGVAANQYLRARLHTETQNAGMQLVTPPIALCTDNAAMIAWAGIERFQLGLIDTLDTEPRARWPIYGENP